MYVTRDSVDEPGVLRAEIRMLRTREAALRRQLLSDAHAQVLDGARHRASIRRVVSRRCDTNLLPDEMRFDPQFTRRVVSTSVRTQVPGAGTRIGTGLQNTGLSSADLQSPDLRSADLRSARQRTCEALGQRGLGGGAGGAGGAVLHHDLPMLFPDLPEQEEFSVIEQFQTCHSHGSTAVASISIRKSGMASACTPIQVFAAGRTSP